VPLYEYQCPKCGRFELIKKFSDAPLETCPTCGSEVQKLLSAPAIQFKGTGWYITDYARKGSGKDGKGESAKAEGTKTEGTKTEGAKEGASSAAEGKSTAAASSTGTKDGGGTAKS
jgi:putative FmdB family regulatory protein